MNCDCDNFDVYRGDDPRAFGETFLEVEADIPEEYLAIISKAVVQVGTFSFTFENPVFPLQIPITAEITKSLAVKNELNLAIYDNQGYKKTCIPEGNNILTTKGEVVNG